MNSQDRWRRIEELFTSALEVPPAKRAKFLLTECGEDKDLRQEVESLLARDSVAQDTRQTPAIASIIEGTAASFFDDDARSDTMVGTELGSYRIIRELGRGGMGAVYLAIRADQAFEKQVAIKVVKRGIDTDAVLQRFWYERRILAGLDHPYIARLVDAGTSPDGRPYFVMEYVDGQPLDTYATEKGLSIPQRCELFRKVCEAVSYAHRNLIIHRDLKPGNILVTGDGTPKLLDFGIARLLSIEPGEHTITGSRDFPLTPEYASPEQVRGDAVTTATDVYSLGATLRAILPGGRAIPHDLVTIVGKATREESEQRFSSVAELSEDLRRYLEGMPILAREQTLVYQATKFVRRHRVAVAAFVMANLLVIAGISAIVWESRRAEAERKEAEQRLSQAVEMADRTLREVNSSIADLPGTTQARRQMVRSTLEYLDRLARDSGNDPRVLTALATAYVRVGEVLGNSDFPNLGDLKGSLATYQRAMGLIQPMLEKDPDNRRMLLLSSQAHEGTGNVLESLGRNNESLAEFRDAIAMADRTLTQSPADEEAQYQSVDAHYSLGMHTYNSDPVETERDARQQLPVVLKLAAARPTDLERQSKLSELYTLLGTAISRQNRISDGLAYHRKAAEVREAIYRQNPRNTRIQRNLMLGYGHVGDTLGSPFTGCLGDYRGALEYYQKAAEIAENMRRADPSDTRARSDVGMIWARIGATRQAAGDPRQSNADLDHAIEQFESLLARSPGNASYALGAALAYEYRGRNMWLLGDRAAAMKWYQKSLAVVRGLSATSLVRVQRIAVEGPIATLTAIAGNRAEAVRMLDALVKEAGEVPASRRDMHLARVWNWYAQSYEALGDYKTAAEGYAKSANCWKNVMGAATVVPYAEQIKQTSRKAEECRKKAGPTKPGIGG